MMATLNGPLSLSTIFKFAGVAAAGGGVFVCVFSVLTNRNGLIFKLYDRYILSLNKAMRAVYMQVPPSQLFLGQLAAILLVLVVEAVQGVPYVPVILVAIAMGPPMYVKQLRQKRIDALEKQIDGFVLSLANALRSTANIGAALESLLTTTQDPMRQEISMVVKEMKLGSTLDQALSTMAIRAGSRPLDAALSAILIGRQVGGDLSNLLETIADTMREMNRLEGVVRTKTAEGRMQLWVLALFPFVLFIGLQIVSPNYFDPLLKTATGYLVLGAAAGCWATSLMIARNIFSVRL